MSVFNQQKPFFDIPDFRNISTISKIIALSLVLVYLLAGISYFKYDELYLYYLSDDIIWLAPGILLFIILLVIFNKPLHKTNWHFIYILLLVNLLCCLFYNLLANFNPIIKLYLIIINIYTLFFLHYYSLRKQTLSPAIIESKLIALTSSIRPHFLFNSINTAISLIQTRPDDAEEILQNMADLFRALLQKGQYSTLKEELEIANTYLDIETIRLGPERLKISWDINAPENTITPHLLLQPLLENAIYHGIEPLLNPDSINIKIYKKANWIYIKISNPLIEKKPLAGIPQVEKKGHKMALKNLTERLQLMFDRDATLKCSRLQNSFEIKIRIPYYQHNIN